MLPRLSPCDTLRLAQGDNRDYHEYNHGRRIHLHDAAYSTEAMALPAKECMSRNLIRMDRTKRGAWSLYGMFDRISSSYIPLPTIRSAI